MFNKKHITAIAALSLSAMLLAGCQENAEPINIVSPAAAGEQQTSSTEPVSSAPAAADETADTSSSNVTENRTAEPTATINVKCAIPNSAPAQAALLKTSPFWFEDGLPEKLLLNGVDHILEERRVDENFPDKEEPIYICPEDQLLVMGYNGNGGGDLYFNHHDDYMYGTLRSYFDCYNVAEEIFNDKTLNGFTPEDAVSRATTLLEQLGITNLGTPEVWAVKAEKANEELNKTEWENKDGTPAEWKQWTEDDEVYYLTFPVEFNGIPVAFTGSMSGSCTQHGFDSEYFTDGTYIEVTVTKDSILDVRTRNLPSADAETVGTVNINVSAQQALDILTECHSAVDFPFAINVNECSLVYVITERNLDTSEYILRPMWKFEMSYENEYSDYSVRMTEYVDAETGKGYFENC